MVRDKGDQEKKICRKVLWEERDEGAPTAELLNSLSFSDFHWLLIRTTLVFTIDFIRAPKK